MNCIYSLLCFCVLIPMIYSTSSHFCYVPGSHLSLETVFPALKLTQICCINMKISFLENWQFNHKLTPPLLHTYQP